MSTMSGIGGLSNDALTSLQQMIGQNSSVSGTSKPQAPPEPGEPPPELWSEVEESAEAAGLTEEEVESLQTELKDAIASAMENVDSSEGPEAGMEAIDNAILTTLQDHGIDTSDVESRMEEMKSKVQSMGPPDMSSGTGGTQNASLVLQSLTGTTSSDDLSSLLSSLFPLVDEEA